MACINNCCNPVIHVLSVSTNTTTNVSTLTLDAAIPNSGPFRLAICNNSCSPSSPLCYTPCEASGAVVLAYSTTTYGNLYAKNGNKVQLSQLIKKCGTVQCQSGYGNSGVLVCTDCLPCANTQFTTTTTTAGA